MRRSNLNLLATTCHGLSAFIADNILPIVFFLTWVWAICGEAVWRTRLWDKRDLKMVTALVCRDLMVVHVILRMEVNTIKMEYMKQYIYSRREVWTYEAMNIEYILDMKQEYMKQKYIPEKNIFQTWIPNISWRKYWNGFILRGYK